MHPGEISSGRRREGTRPPLRPQGRYRVATATALRPALDPGDHYGPADADTTRADASGAHPSRAADGHQHSGAPTKRPRGRLQMVSRHYEQKSLAKKSYT